jgi:membrane protein
MTSSERDTMKSAKDLFGLVKDTAVRWSDDQCLRLGASLAYYAVFSIFPLLLLCVTAIGFVMGHDASVRDRLLDYVSKSGSPEMRPLLDQTLASMQTHETARGVGAVIGVVTLWFGASGVFSELEATLNIIWRVKSPATTSFWQTVIALIKDKALSFLVVLGTAVALLLSLLVSAALSAVDSSASEIVQSPVVWLLVEAGVSIALLTGLFAAMYRMIPQTEIAWRDVLGGALLAAILFTGLKRLLAWYLGHIGSYAAYGAVGGMLGLLAWIYLASLILFFGAEFTRVYAERYGSLVNRKNPSEERSQPAASSYSSAGEVRKQPV